jgi:hypothetical protein
LLLAYLMLVSIQISAQWVIVYLEWTVNIQFNGEKNVSIEGQALNKLGNIRSMTVNLCSLSYRVYIFNLWMLAFNTTEDFEQKPKHKES